MTTATPPAPVEEAPLVTDVVVREFVRGLMRHSECYPQRIVLLAGRYDPASSTGMTVDGMQVRVADCPSVLAALQASLDHRHADGILVLLTTRTAAELGADLCGKAIKQRPLPVHRWEIALRRFGARELDPRLRGLRWVADGLLEVEPAQGWPKLPGALLDYDTALRHLARRRLNLPDEMLDITDLLTADPALLAGLDRLRPAERNGLRGWLINQLGPAAHVVLALAGAGHGADVLPFALVLDVLWDDHAAEPQLARAQGRAQGRAEAYLGASIEPVAARAVGRAAAQIMTRWLGGGSSRDAPGAGDGPGNQVETVLRRADHLLDLFGACDLAEHGVLLDAGLRARLRALAAALDAALDRPTEHLPAMEAALACVTGHRLRPVRAEQVMLAAMAARLVRWLAQPVADPETVGDGIAGQARQWGWVDRAAAALWRGDPLAETATTAVYARIHDATRAARDRLDAAFADRLAAWSPASAAPAELLLVEHVLDRVAVPLTEHAHRPPLLVVVDGMSTAIAAELTEQIRARGFTEVVRNPFGREGAVAAIPSVTGVNRASLLSGRLTTGTADTESAGFATFWRQHRQAAVLFHKADLPGPAGHRLAPAVQTAMSRVQNADRTVVGVVLNTVDDALDHGRECGRVDWTLEDIAFLPELLTDAQRQGRPVLLVSDHGHVLERERGTPCGQDASSARWRPAGEPAGDGEILLSGERVLLGGGQVVTAWRETIRYAPRRAGYHGGASLAEMTIPVLVFVPTPDSPLPAGWQALSPERGTPSWWTAGPPVETTAPVATARTPSPRRAPAPDGLFDLPEPTATSPDTLGRRVVASRAYDAQRQYVRKPPPEQTIADIIDTLARTGDRLSTTALAEQAHIPAMRIPGLVAMLRTLLNVEGYPVLTLIDNGQTVELDRALLHQQFGLGPVGR